MDTPHGMSPTDQDSLRKAKCLLEHPGIAIQFANALGTPVEYLLEKPLPRSAKKALNAITRKVVSAGCRFALTTMKRNVVPAKPHNGWHKLAVVATGAVGGFFGIAGTPVELPITTTTMLRSILDIARSHGEPMDAPETRIACLEVLAFGGPVKSDDAADMGYLAVRAALAQQVSAAVNHLATKGLTDRGAPVLVSLMTRIATYFAIPISEKLAAQAVPVAGAAAGSILNAIFISHYQRMAEGHFTVRQLERRYGQDVVRVAYENL